MLSTRVGSGGTFAKRSGLTMPSVSAGSVPYRTFSGEACSTAIDLITIPEVQEFIVTMVTSTAQAHNSANVSYP